MTNSKEALEVNHELKQLSEYFLAVKCNIKRFEIRKNDRDFKLGQIVRLNEWSGIDYTGEFIDVIITYITDFEQKEDYIVFGFSPIRAALEAQAEKDRVMWIDAYMRGFKQSAEGWNGEICLDNELEKVRQQAITEYNKLKGE